MIRFLIVLVVIGLVLVDATKVLRIKPTKLESWSENNLLKYAITIDESVPYANFTFNVLQQIDNVDVHIEILLTEKNDNVHYASFNTTYNLCKILDLKATSPVAALVFAYFKDHGNLPDKCPIPKGVYTIHKIWLPEEQAPAHPPELLLSGKTESFTTIGDKTVKISKCEWEAESTIKEVSGPHGLMSLFSGK